MDVLYIGLAIWLAILTAVVAWIFSYFRKLAKISTKGDFKKLIGKIIDIQDKNAKSIKGIKTEIEKIEDDAKFHIQKVGLVRFNPFQEMGGDHSFSLALLDGKDTGVVITGLHSRDRTRVYIKKIKAGKSKLSLSDEETKALSVALKGKK